MFRLSVLWSPHVHAQVYTHLYIHLQTTHIVIKKNTCRGHYPTGFGAWVLEKQILHYNRTQWRQNIEDAGEPDMLSCMLGTSEALSAIPNIRNNKQGNIHVLAR